MISLNRVTLMGNVGANPEQIDSWCWFPVGTQNVWKDRQGVTQKANEWNKVRAYGFNCTNVMQWVKKGHPVYLEGRLVSKMHDDGSYETYVKLEKIDFLNKLANR